MYCLTFFSTYGNLFSDFLLLSVLIYYYHYFKSSVLNGGFEGAVRYINRPDTPFNISSALVEIVDKQALFTLIGAEASMEEGSNILQSVGTFFKAKTSFISSNINNVIDRWQNKATEESSEVNHSSHSSKEEEEKRNPKESNIQSSQPETSKNLLNDIGKRLSWFGATSLESIKKGMSTFNPSTNPANDHPKKDLSIKTAPLVHSASQPPPSPEDIKMRSQPVSNFIIDEDDEEQLSKMFPDTDKVNVVKTDKERALALAQHKMAGIKKGDKLTITKADLPGAILFPSIKLKESQNESGEVITTQLHRYLAISKERFIVLDSNGEGVGSEAIVKSNHHLSEVR